VLPEAHLRRRRQNPARVPAGARLRFERAACRDATLAELTHLDTLSSDQLLRQSPAVLDNLFERLDLNPPQAVANGSKVMPFKTIISEWAKERKGRT
jgi:hypothetical protein